MEIFNLSLMKKLKQNLRIFAGKSVICKYTYLLYLVLLVSCSTVVSKREKEAFSKTAEQLQVENMKYEKNGTIDYGEDKKTETRVYKIIIDDTRISNMIINGKSVYGAILLYNNLLEEGVEGDFVVETEIRNTDTTIKHTFDQPLLKKLTNVVKFSENFIALLRKNALTDIKGLFDTTTSTLSTEEIDGAIDFFKNENKQGGNVTFSRIGAVEFDKKSIQNKSFRSQVLIHVIRASSKKYYILHINSGDHLSIYSLSADTY